MGGESGPPLYLVGYIRVHNTYLNAIRLARENGANMRIRGRRVRRLVNLSEWHCAPAPWALHLLGADISRSSGLLDLVQR